MINVIIKHKSFLLLFLSIVVIKQMSFAQDNSVAKNSSVKGIVNSNKNEPVEGVSVIIRNTKNNFTSGTTTDANGSFSFPRVPMGGPYTFIFSAVGYESQSLKGYNISDDVTLSLLVKLKDSSTILDQVVVVGYGTQKRKDLTGAVSSIKSQDIGDMAITRIDQALVGKAAGVQVKPSTGEPGASPQIRIRGIGSISAGASPLYVIDGFPTGNIETLNPNDIESVDILKDASATAIYGSRGSNGVVIINTKRGKAGKTSISLDTYHGWQKVERKPKMMNAREQAQYFYDGVKNRNLDEGNNISGPPTSWVRPMPAIIMDVLEGRNTYDEDALDAVLITAPTSQFQLTISGGNATTKYLLSGEYLNQDGIVLNSHFTRYSMRANFDTKLSPKLSLKANLNPSFTDKMVLPVTGNQGENILGSAISVSNFYPLLDSAGNYFIFGGLPAQADFHNPLALAMEYQANQKMMRFLGNIDAEYQFNKELAFRALLGATLINSRGMTFKPQLPVFFNNPAVGSDNSSASYNWITEYTLNYNKTIDKHQIVALAGFTAQKEHGDLNSLTSNKYPNNLVTSLSATSGVITGGTSESYEWSMLSYLGRVNYNYNSKYYVTASIRTDGSSRFGNEKRYGVFPSAALAWRLSNEKFLQNISFLSELKLRASYGETGNNNIGNYEQYATINYEKYAFGGIAVGGFAPGRLANPMLTWETQKSFNLGVDASVFNHRVSVSVDRFQSRNYDLLLNVNIPLVTGFSTALENIGEVKNSGWEFVVNTINLNGKLKWSTDFNLSTFRNEVVRLGPEGDPIIADNNITMIGKPIGMFYGFLVNGIFKTQTELSQGPIFNPGASDRSRAGDIRFVDVSGPNGKPDGIINSFDNTIIGSPYPDFYYGMTNRFSYKNFGLIVSMQGSKGAQVYNTSFGSGSATRARVRVYAYNNNYWKSEQDPGDGLTPRPNDAPTGGVRLSSQRYLDDGSYLRINNITLDYIFSNKLLQKISISSARIYIGATNPFLFTKYKKYNPDVSLNEDPLRPGVESNNYPLPKTLLIGLNVSF
jgi:TonB-linked SusC/RagA family outer membrane protein